MAWFVTVGGAEPVTPELEPSPTMALIIRGAVAVPLGEPVILWAAGSVLALGMALNFPRGHWFGIRT